MTVANTVWAWEQELPCAPKFLLVTLADCLGMANTFDADFRRLGSKCGLSVDEVKLGLMALEDAGFMSIWRFKVPGLSEPNWRCTIHYPEEVEDDGDFHGPKAPRIGRPGWLYVIATEYGLSKIGITSDLMKRTRDLESTNAVSIRLAWSHECDLVSARKVEQAVLRKFAALRAKGEWIKLASGDVISAAESMLAEMKIGGPP